MRLCSDRIWNSRDSLCFLFSRWVAWKAVCLRIHCPYLFSSSKEWCRVLCIYFHISLDVWHWKLCVSTIDCLVKSCVYLLQLTVTVLWTTNPYPTYWKATHVLSVHVFLISRVVSSALYMCFLISLNEWCGELCSYIYYTAIFIWMSRKKEKKVTTVARAHP